jgi:hypothetical protein
MDKRVKISVTEDDISKGKPGQPRSCPIARAAARSFGCSSKCVSVGPLDMSVAGDELDFYAVLPACAQTFIGRFDSNDPVKPFSFYVQQWERG